MPAYRKMSYPDACEVLEKGAYGVLATVGEGGKPYGVPLFYVVDGHHLWFCCTDEGQTIQNLRQHPPVSFTVVEQAANLYHSIIAFGEVHAVTDLAEQRAALDALSRKYGASTHPDTSTVVWRMDVEYVSGRMT